MSLSGVSNLGGVLNVDKPAGLTSAAVVGRIKRLLPRGVKVGHAGTLDNFATGVLLVLVGKATRECEALMGRPKRYRAVIRLGATTATLDPDSPEQPASPIDPPTREAVDAELRGFVGPIEQMPPVFSALKVGGRRASDLARAGEDVPLKARPVMVYDASVIDYAWPTLTIDVHCGRGFYVRALARDLAAALGTAGYLTALRRTAVGDHTEEQAASLAALTPTSLAALLTPAGNQQRPPLDDRGT